MSFLTKYVKMSSFKYVTNIKVIDVFYIISLY